MYRWDKNQGNEREHRKPIATLNPLLLSLTINFDLRNNRRAKESSNPIARTYKFHNYPHLHCYSDKILKQVLLDTKIPISKTDIWKLQNCIKYYGKGQLLHCLFTKIKLTKKPNKTDRNIFAYKNNSPRI